MAPLPHGGLHPHPGCATISQKMCHCISNKKAFTFGSAELKALKCQFYITESNFQHVIKVGKLSYTFLLCFCCWVETHLDCARITGSDHGRSPYSTAQVSKQHEKAPADDTVLYSIKLEGFFALKFNNFL